MIRQIWISLPVHPQCQMQEMSGGDEKLLFFFLMTHYCGSKVEVEHSRRRLGGTSARHKVCDPWMFIFHYLQLLITDTLTHSARSQRQKHTLRHSSLSVFCVFQMVTLYQNDLSDPCRSCFNPPSKVAPSFSHLSYPSVSSQKDLNSFCSPTNCSDKSCDNC